MAVGETGGGELIGAFVAVDPNVGDFGFEGCDPPVEPVDVVGGAQAGLPPGLLAEDFGQSAFKLLHPSGEPGGAVLRGVESDCSEARDRRGPWGRAVGRVRVECVQLFEQVGVAVEEGPIDGGPPGDHADGDLLAAGGRLGEGGEDALTAPVAVGSPSRGHGGSASGTRRTWGMPMATAR